MRLFIAVNFSDDIKNSLCDIIEKMKSHSLSGNFTLRDNLHLTLVFIGETSDANAVKRAMEAVSCSPFVLNAGGIGKFKRSGGDIYYLKVKRNDNLSKVQKKLSGELENLGFEIEKREFKPHLTLGREVISENDFYTTEVPEINIKVNKISLMKSERQRGKLIYTEIYAKELR